MFSIKNRTRNKQNDDSDNSSVSDDAVTEQEQSRKQEQPVQVPTSKRARLRQKLHNIKEAILSLAGTKKKQQQDEIAVAAAANVGNDDSYDSSDDEGTVDPSNSHRAKPKQKRKSRRRDDDDDDDEAYLSGSSGSSSNANDSDDEDDDESGDIESSDDDHEKTVPKMTTPAFDSKNPPSFVKPTESSKMKQSEKKPLTSIGPAATHNNNNKDSKQSVDEVQPIPSPSGLYPKPAIMIKLPSEEQQHPSLLRRSIRRMKQWKWRLVTLTDQGVNLTPSLIYSDLASGEWKGQFSLDSISAAESVAADFMKQNGCPAGMEMKGWRIVAAGRTYIFATETMHIRDVYVRWIQDNVLSDPTKLAHLKAVAASAAVTAAAKSAGAVGPPTTANDNNKAGGKTPNASSLASSSSPQPPSTAVSRSPLPQWLLQIGAKSGVPNDVLQTILEQRIDDEETLLMLTSEDLSSLNVPLGPKMKLLKYIGAAKSNSSGSVAAAGGSGSGSVGVVDDDDASGERSSPFPSPTLDKAKISGSEGDDKSSVALQEMMKKISEKFHRTLIVQPNDVEIFFDAQLGSGGYASVFEATTAQGRPVAAKVFDRFDDGLDECLMLSQLHHRNVIGVVGVTASVRKSKSVRTSSMTAPPGRSAVATAASPLIPPQHHQQARFVMLLELAEGTLADLLNTQKSYEVFTFDVVLRFALQIADGLKYLHTRSPHILHLDLKCTNLLFFNTILKLADFGISKSTLSTKTQVTSAKGTLFFVAPEVVESNQVAATNDTYAFGVILFQLLTLKSPAEVLMVPKAPGEYVAPPMPRDVPLLLCQALDRELFFNKQQQQDPKSETEGDFLVEICKRCLNVDPALRPKDGDELFNLLIEGASKSSARSSMLVMGVLPANNHHHHHAHHHHQQHHHRNGTSVPLKGEREGANSRAELEHVEEGQPTQADQQVTSTKVLSFGDTF